MSVLEIGCGVGRRCLEIATSGADRVVGVDPTENPVVMGRRDEVLSKASVELCNRIVFFRGTIETLPPETFDVVVSEDTLEHVLNVSDLFEQAKNRLKPGGKFYLGFGPPYHAPTGDHGWLRAVLPGRRFFAWPWGHLVFERLAFQRLSKLYGKLVTNTHDWP
jgi:SAM-dependent methyltransferase